MPTLAPHWRGWFRAFNLGMVLMWRLGLGPLINFWPAVVGRILVLIHRGRKTGATHYTPVNYALVGGDVYCVAGFGTVADWYKNLQVNPQVEVWLPTGRWVGLATEMTDPTTRLSLVRAVLQASGFAAYAAGLDPYRLSDAALAAATEEYRLMRIQRVASRTGPDGPGAWAWVWLVGGAVGAGVALWLARRWSRR